jgi:hypothetical protein
MKRLFLSLVVIGAIYSLLKKERSRTPAPSDRPDINQWEDEGGAVPRAGDGSAAQVEPGPA